MTYTRPSSYHDAYSIPWHYLVVKDGDYFELGLESQDRTMHITLASAETERELLERIDDEARAMHEAIDPGEDRRYIGTAYSTHIGPVRFAQKKVEPEEKWVITPEGEGR